MYICYYLIKQSNKCYKDKRYVKRPYCVRDNRYVLTQQQ